jgi:hypothetical protein
MIKHTHAPNRMKTTAPAAANPDVAATDADLAESEVPTASADPVVADEVGHPVGVGIGALSAGAAGAAIGAVVGPIGMVVGAVVGAFAGGLVGEEVASAGDDAETDNPDSTYTTPDLVEPTSLATGGSVLGYSPVSTSGSLYSGSDAGGYGNVDTTPDIPAIPAAEAELKYLQKQPPSPPVATPEGSHPASEEVIRTSAYYRYVGRSAAGESGDELQDWLQAERELSS